MDDKLSKHKFEMLDKLTGRDTTIIKHYLDIIHQNIKKLWYYTKEGEQTKKIDIGKLDSLTLTARAFSRKGIRYEGRNKVPYDLKQEFLNQVTTRELHELRDTAIAMYALYITNISKHENKYWAFHNQINNYDGREDALASILYWLEQDKKPALPCYAKNYKLKKLPRRILTGLDKKGIKVGTGYLVHNQKTSLTDYWFDVYSHQRKITKSGKRKGFPSDRLVNHYWLPLNVSEYHQEQLQLGKPKSFQLVKHDNKRWYLHVTIEQQLVEPKEVQIVKPKAILCGDFGMNRDVTTVLLQQTPDITSKDIRIFKDKHKKKRLNQLDTEIASLQRTRANRMTKNKSRLIPKPVKNIKRRLRALRHERARLSELYDHELTKQIALHVQELAQSYDLQIAFGRLKGIRYSRWKGDGKSKKHRKRLHRWSYGRITHFLTYKLKKAGFTDKQIHSVKEHYTSKTCSKCGSRNTERPCQSLLICHGCSIQNADINAAINIGSKLIVSQLIDIYGDVENIEADQWLINTRVRAWVASMATSQSKPILEISGISNRDEEDFSRKSICNVSGLEKDTDNLVDSESVSGNQ